MLRIVETTDLAALNRTGWDALIASAPDGTVFQSFDWLVAWWNAFGGRCRILLITAEKGTELVGAAPLFIDEVSGRPSIRFIGEHHADYLTFPVRNGAVEIVDQLLSHLECHYGAGYDFHLLDVPDTSALALSLRRREICMPLRLLRTKVTPCPRLKLKGNDGQVEQALTKKSLKRHAAGLRAQGPVEVRHLTDAQSILLQLDHFFQQHQRRWAVTPYPSLFEAKANRDFYRNLVQSRLSGKSLVLTTVHVGTRLVACHFGLISRADLIWYKPSFEPGLSRYSPGEVMLGQLLLLAREQGFEHLDFTRGDEPFKSRFSSEVRYNTSYQIYASRAIALAARAYLCSKAVLERSLSETSSTRQFLRLSKQNYSAARQAGNSLPKAMMTSAQLAAANWLRWVFSRRSVHLFGNAESPRPTREIHLQVREANLDYLLGASGDLAKLSSSNRRCLSDAHKRFAQGQRCFVVEEDKHVAAIGWVRTHSPHAIDELEAELRFREPIVVLYDFDIAQSSRGGELYSQLLLGIRLALGAVSALGYADDLNIPLVEGFRRAGFTPEAAIDYRILAGCRRLTLRPSRWRSLSWELLR